VNFAGWYHTIEVAQVVVALLGLAGTIMEADATRRLALIPGSKVELLLARQGVVSELLRFVAQLVILLTALISLWLPEPPAYMPDWVMEPLFWRKVGLLLVAVVISAGTWTSRRTRILVAEELRWTLPKYNRD
jgi:hypothetical protein